MSSLSHKQEVDPLDREFVPGWAEEPGDKIRGIPTGRDQRDAGYGEYPIWVLALGEGFEARTKEGDFVTDQIAVHARRDVLRRKLENAGIELGHTEVGIRYDGPPSGTAVSHRYRVVVYLPDGKFWEVPYDLQDDQPEHSRVLDRPAEDDADAATEAALEAERNQRDETVMDLPPDTRGLEHLPGAKSKTSVQSSEDDIPF